MFNKNRAKLRNLWLFLAVLSLSFRTAACYAEDKSDDAQKLLKERRELLTEAVSSMLEMILKVDLLEMLQAERELFKADLDSINKAEDRIKAIEQHKGIADSILEHAKARKQGFTVNEYVVSLAKAYVLEVQIELLKEKQKAKSRK